MYSYLSIVIPKYNLSQHMYLAPGVETKLSNISFSVFRSIVGVHTYTG